MDNQPRKQAGTEPVVTSPHDNVGDARTHTPRRTREDLTHIQGWGADLDHENRPGYPMERTPPRLDNVHWEHPENQPVSVKVYHSTERPGLTPIFGTTAPPSGLSGKIRDVAYKIAENDIRRWLLLLMADRVNVVEGIGEDLRNGHVPNIFSEMGLKAELKYNRAGFLRKVAVASAVVGAACLLMRRSKGR